MICVGKNVANFTQIAEAQKGPDTMVLRCDFCDNILGTTKPSEDLIRLSKFSIAVNKSGSNTVFQSYPASVFICAQILSLIEATALKRFVVHSASSESVAGEPKIEPLIMWIFNPDIYYSCSAYDGTGILPNITSHTTGDTNPHDHDTSQIYSENTAELPHRPAPQTNPDQAKFEGTTDSSKMQNGHAVPLHRSHRNPNQDDISQIYGPSEGPQIVSGELRFEVPLPERHPKMTADSNLPHVEPMLDTETPFISAKSKTEAQAENKPQVILRPSQEPSDTPNEHVNLVHRATKIFYQPLPADETPAFFLDANSTTHEELYLSSPEELAELRATLEKSNAMLPASAKAFQDWKVGLLNRYEKVPSGLGVMQENPLARGIKAKDGRVTRWSIGNGAEGLYS